METIINALLENFSAHNFGACTNASCYQIKTYLYDGYTRNSLRKHICKQPDSLQMALVSLMDEKLDLQKNGRNVILFDVYFENCFISTYWL